MKKVFEPEIINEVWNCPRCGQDYCGDCVEIHEVDFSVMDTGEVSQIVRIDWEGTLVCPWCYNQLMVIVNNKEILEDAK